MANITKRGSRWQARTNCKGIRQSATFALKPEAVAWAAQIENEILSGQRGQVKAVTLGKLLQEYAEKVTPKKVDTKWELNYIKRFLREDIASIKLSNLSAVDVAIWRDKRLETVSAGAVRREWNVLSPAVNTAIKEWGWLTVNPFSKVKRPDPPASRDRLFSQKEIELLTYHLDCAPDSDMKKIKSRVGSAMLFALETGMREGEVANLTWDCMTETVAEVKKGKTLSARRRVPLSIEARRIINQLPKTFDTVFGVTAGQIDSNFRGAKKDCLIAGLHFHDSRANACTKLAKIVEILALARIMGIKDLKILMVYYRESAEDIALRIY